ncbi:carbamoyltransferase N-terminal domain-containing protein [Streptantibioticus silvisoli]|uniref:Carbamoyltransferase N-terminal domain-containing protein n=1 Tax=Streptantibioticus silvisoli TaxID=2705255 RepID=A0ABT6W939_9ACTN|nr:carbamoyltransferase N-terminal domain-containing protein [Streptantibioticus silvisoli]MDI5967268.1 carbamoyltransferase N-terminal domain-containing protein [Streptantibioticus silvisoli]
MLIVGVKASHDGGVALIDGNRLVLSVEIEKLGNNPRYSRLRDLEQVCEILRDHGVDPADVDQFVVDGWWPEKGASTPSVSTTANGAPLTLPVAPYVDGVGALDPLERYAFTAHDFTANAPGYVSYHHASNHAVGSYCTSPFAARGEDSLALVWDGGISPRLYHVSAQARTVRPVAPLFPVTGNIFADFCMYFDPFRPDPAAEGDNETHHLSVAGKAMAYAALGTCDRDAFPVFDRLFEELTSISTENADELGARVAAERDQLFPGRSNADIIATFQEYVGEMLLRRLTDLVKQRFMGQRLNLCLGGGCALNIKWNSVIRNSGLFRDVWIPPFPNDSGAAIGTAACELFRSGEPAALEWDVYSGPRVGPVGELPQGWTSRPCDERELALLLHTEGEPVVVIDGRAELGPRALGNRSILAPAVDPGMKKRLNEIKNRAGYRPVAPLCLTSRSAEIFDPGTPDRYMLFDHQMRPGWAERVPAIVHLDGSARLQTIDPSVDCAASRVLAAYEALSGVPVLCNTSANLNGSGFFPDVASVAAWGRTKYIWSAGVLYVNPRS